MNATGLPLFDFDGSTYERKPDQIRLNAQLRRVASLMSDGRWRTLSEIASQTGDPEASISARLRDLTKSRFGGSEMTKQRRGEESRGLWEYRVVLSRGTRAAMEGRDA